MNFLDKYYLKLKIILCNLCNKKIYIFDVVCGFLCLSGRFGRVFCVSFGGGDRVFFLRFAPYSEPVFLSFLIFCGCFRGGVGRFVRRRYGARTVAESDCV